MTSLIGASTARSDAESKVRGEAVYGVDYSSVGMLHARLLRSPIPAGSITKLDVTAARNLPGVRSVVTGSDAPVARGGAVVRDQPLFATSVVRYEGEPIAGVIAESEQIAKSALRAIVLEIDALPPVGDVEAALAPGARLVHPDWMDYECLLEYPRAGNIACEVTSDTDLRALARIVERADVIVESEYRAQRQYQAYIEPKSAVALWENGRYVIHTASQFPFNVRDQVA